MIGGLFKSASRVALFAAAGVLAGGVAAQAADLGGNCCADLEERVAELEATAARKGNRKVSLTVYGQVNKALLWHDDEYGYREGKLTVRDNGANMSRFGFRGEAQIRPDFKAGYLIEIGLGGEDFGMTSDDAFQIRQNHVYLDSATFGRITLGQSSTVTDGLWTINLANTQVTHGEMDEHSSVLSMPFQDTFRDVFDGPRAQGVFYRSPTFGGFILSAGWYHGTQADKDTVAAPGYSPDDADEAWEVALRYAGEFNGIRIAGGVGYRKEIENDNSSTVVLGSRNADNEIWMASGSVMHTPTGLFVAGGYADRDSDDVRNRRDAFWLSAGIEKNWFGVGNTTLFGQYAQYDMDSNAEVYDGSYWGLGITQSIDAAATDLYVNFRQYQLDDVVAQETYTEDTANVITAGMIIKF